MLLVLLQYPKCHHGLWKVAARERILVPLPAAILAQYCTVPMYYIAPERKVKHNVSCFTRPSRIANLPILHWWWQPLKTHTTICNYNIQHFFRLCKPKLFFLPTFSITKFSHCRRVPDIRSVIVNLDRYHTTNRPAANEKGPLTGGCPISSMVTVNIYIRN